MSPSQGREQYSTAPINQHLSTIRCHHMPESGGLQRSREPHASIDRAGRALKARKIVAIIGLDRFSQANRILEVGCGSGVISHTLFDLGNRRQTIEAVDVKDGRIDTEGYRFTLVSDTSLPFADDQFDLVITNHVIEHVGDESAQINHLREIKRVTSPGGMVYFAAPNKWRLIEPHFRLPLLSWLPRRASDTYVRLTGRGTHYDCSPMSLRRLERLLRTAGFAFQDRTTLAIRETLAIEHQGNALSRVVNALPDWILTMGMPLMPTYVFQLTPESTP